MGERTTAEPMTLEQAYVTGLRGRNFPDSKVTVDDVDRARVVLKAHWAGSYSLDEVTVERGERSADDFVSLLTGGKVAKWSQVPIWEWSEAWADVTGSPAGITCHPYHPRAEQVQRALAFCELAGLEFSIQGYGSWKNPGHAVIFEYLKPRAAQKPDERVVGHVANPARHPKTRL